MSTLGHLADRLRACPPADMRPRNHAKFFDNLDKFDDEHGGVPVREFLALARGDPREMLVSWTERTDGVGRMPDVVAALLDLPELGGV